MEAESLDDWLSELEQLHPAAIDLGLERCGSVAKRLGLTEPAATTITVAGTNGKGSTVAVMESVLLAQGVTCGAFTSPHLVRYNERIRVNGLEVDDALIIRAFEAIESARDQTSLTYFEFNALAALWIFRELKVDYQLLEVGLGGRLDAVNIIDADVAVITAIGLDHQEWLGNDVETIAIEKCGIARAGRPCIVADERAPVTVMQTLDRLGAEAIRAGHHYRFTSDVFHGPKDKQFSWHVPKGVIPMNAAAAIAALITAGIDLDETSFAESVSRLNLRGRREHKIVKGLSVVMDVAHNPDAARELHQFLATLPEVDNTVAVFAVMSDKECRDMIFALENDIDFWCLPHGIGGERGQDPTQLAQQLGDKSRVFATFNESIEHALARLNSDAGRLIIFGSFFTVAAGMLALENADRFVLGGADA